MSDVPTTEKRGSMPLQNTEPARCPLSLRVWPAVTIVAAYWGFFIATQVVSLSNFERFISRFVAFAVFFLALVGWWLTRRAVPRRERWLAVLVVLAVGGGVYAVADKSMDAFGLLMSAFPLVATVAVAWLVVSRFVSPAMRRVGFCAAVLLAIGYFGLVRFDGLDAHQWGETSWRWQPTREEISLASRRSNTDRGNEAETADESPWSPQPGDCLAYRGDHRDGIVPDLRLAVNWSEQSPRLLWRERVGPSWSSVIVVDGRVVTQEQLGDDEVVVCRDAATGREIWIHKDPVRFEEKLSGAGPRATPTFADSRIYALGAKGNLNCLEARTGALLWSHDIVADAGVEPAEIPQWGYSVSPLVVDGLVIVFAGGSKDKSVLAYDADNGNVVWTCPGGKQSYSSPQLMTLAGKKQIVMHDNAAVRGIDVVDGKQLWEYPNRSEFAVPMYQPHQTDHGEVVISCEPALTLLRVELADGKWMVTPSWTNHRFRPGFNDFVLHKGVLYGLDDGILAAFDLENGDRLWKKGRMGHGQVLLLPEQDALVVSSDRGQVMLVAVDRSGQQELGRFQAIEGKTWNSPVLAGAKLFLRNGEELAAYELTLAIGTSELPGQ